MDLTSIRPEAGEGSVVTQAVKAICQDYGTEDWRGVVREGVSEEVILGRGLSGREAAVERSRRGKNKGLEGERGLAISPSARGGEDSG